MPDAPRKHRLRFSLTTLVLLTTIVALCLAIVALWRGVAPLRAELRDLRDEVGVLRVSDPGRVHVLRVKSIREGSWLFRVWIPEGGPYYLCLGSVDKPAKMHPELPLMGDTPRVDTWIQVAPGEHQIDITAELVERDGIVETLAVRYAIDKVQEFPFPYKMDIARHPHRRLLLMESNWSAAAFSTRSVAPGEPITILGYRNRGWGSGAERGSLEPLLFWIATE